ncbi:hypothetical protein [Manganibacter manganicus]|jgi:hypothetical protein|nr:hypothetical protein [Pseudaminobacter manganicus]
MAEEGQKSKSVISSAEAASGAESGNTLLPMLIAGLILIVIGAIAVMVFV